MHHDIAKSQNLAQVESVIEAEIGEISTRDLKYTDDKKNIFEKSLKTSFF